MVRSECTWLDGILVIILKNLPHMSDWAKDDGTKLVVESDVSIHRKRLQCCTQRNAQIPISSLAIWGSNGYAPQISNT